ncbi:polysaccharide biosynthesis protein, partial [Vibrio parahaemolyticus]|nr:polysaccharide biosynthesis protein [Vibrio parahaemolyticus]
MSIRNSKILSNLANLGVIKLLTLGFPLLVIPVILNKIGLERYGEYVFYSSVISYFVYLVNFGIDESATLIINR